MMRVSRWLAQRAAPGFDQSGNEDARARVGLLQGWMGIGLNTLLVAVKGGLGILTESVALLADAANNLADSASSVVVIAGFRMARRPADEEHPFGHGRVESVAGIVIGVLLGVVAFEFLRSSVERIIHPKDIFGQRWWMIAVVAATMILKWLFARFSHDLGVLIDSHTLEADAWNHRSDVLATGLVLVAFVAARWHLHWMDGVMGVGVALIIGYAAWTAIRQAMGPLIGEHTPEGMQREIEGIARAVPGVHDVHDILVHRYGGTHIISLHIEADDTETPLHLHEMSEDIEERVAKRFPGHAIVHVDPINRNHEYYELARKTVSDGLAAEPSVASFHDLRILGSDRRVKVVFDVVMAAGVREVSARELRARIEHRLRQHLPTARVVLTVEPAYFRSAPAENAEGEMRDEQKGNPHSTIPNPHS